MEWRAPLPHPTLWSRCLDHLESALSEQQLNTWIRPLQARQDGPRLVIMAPNRFVLDMVKNNFLEQIETIATQCSHPDEVKIFLRIGSDDSAPAAERGFEVIPGSGGSHHATNAGSGCQGGSGNRGSANDETLGSNTLPPNHSQVARPARQHDSYLKPEYTFEKLVAGNSNQLAHAAAMQIARQPGQHYNPFLIYGASGLGKTHLMQAIGHSMIATNPDARVLYVNSERYVADMVASLQHGRMSTFKERYRSVDALLVDDVQFFAGKEQTQEEFFHTFNALFDNNQQIVLTCDRYVKEVAGLEDRLKSRFGGGFSVSIEPPELEMRVAILHSKAEQLMVELPNEVAFFIARHIRSNVRELEGALRRVSAQAMILGGEITLEHARDTLADLISVHARQVTIPNIQNVVAEYYSIRLSELLGPRRTRDVVRPRQMAMTLAKELTDKSFPEIGRAFGGRDHSTVMHACDRITKQLDSDEDLAVDYRNLQRTLMA
ncbi:MAG: chromosomal replication initiator protein DnaA [Gammaproteobacteria bacterium]|nr:MAG: chromosomal replication initiator protein DnaA [Gammaproteobacteria bacterium]PIE37338.1 MAG: chromosomal replication initiator protein DnaA [Gammaproteobacteria bacterium]